MVLKCTHYTTHITLNVSHTGCTVASQLVFELGSLVWRAGSLPIKPSGPALAPPPQNDQLLVRDRSKGKLWDPEAQRAQIIGPLPSPHSSLGGA